MEPLIKANLLAVGLNGKTELLSELPIRLVSVESAKQAVCCIRNDRFEGVLSTWSLDDMPEGLFLKRLRMVKPSLTQEIMARSIGVSAVLTEGCGDEFFLQTVASVLGLELPAEVISIHEIKQSTAAGKNFGRLIS